MPKGLYIGLLVGFANIEYLIFDELSENLSRFYEFKKSFFHDFTSYLVTYSQVSVYVIDITLMLISQKYPKK